MKHSKSKYSLFCTSLEFGLPIKDTSIMSLLAAIDSIFMSQRDIKPLSFLLLKGTRLIMSFESDGFGITKITQHSEDK